MIRLNQIKRENNGYRLLTDIQHPFVYKSGSIDLSGLKKEVIESALKDEYLGSLIVYAYLNNPEQFTTNMVPIYKDYEHLYTTRKN